MDGQKVTDKTSACVRSVTPVTQMCTLMRGAVQAFHAKHAERDAKWPRHSVATKRRPRRFEAYATGSRRVGRYLALGDSFDLKCKVFRCVSFDCNGKLFRCKFDSKSGITHNIGHISINVTHLPLVIVQHQGGLNLVCKGRISIVPKVQLQEGKHTLCGSYKYIFGRLPEDSKT